MRWITTYWAQMREVWSYRHEPERLRRLADAYWRGLLLITGVVVLGAVLYGSLKLFEALDRRQDEALLLPRGSGGGALNPVELRATLDGFAARAANYEFLKKNPPKISDPSR